MASQSAFACGSPDSIGNGIGIGIEPQSESEAVGSSQWSLGSLGGFIIINHESINKPGIMN